RGRIVGEGAGAGVHGNQRAGAGIAGAVGQRVAGIAGLAGGDIAADTAVEDLGVLRSEERRVGGERAAVGDGDVDGDGGARAHAVVVGNGVAEGVGHGVADLDGLEAGNRGRIVGEGAGAGVHGNQRAGAGIAGAVGQPVAGIAGLAGGDIAADTAVEDLGVL